MSRRVRTVLTGPYGRAALGLALSTLFIVLFLRNTDFGDVGRAFTDADLPLILPAIVVYFAGLYFRAVRWHYLLLHIERISPLRLLPIVTIGFGVNNVLPFRTGEVVRAHVLREQHGISRASGLSSIFMTRVYDGLMLTIFLCVGVAASLVGFEGMVFAGDVLLAGMAFLVFGVSLAFLLFRWIARHPERAEERVHSLTEQLPGLRRRRFSWLPALIEGVRSQANPQQVSGALWTSAVAWGLESLMYFMVGEAFGLDLPFPVYLLVAAGANIMITAPSTSGGVGPFEWATKEVLLIYLVASNAEELAIAYAATLHGLVLVPTALIGLALLWVLHVPLRIATVGRPYEHADGGALVKARPQ